MKRFAQITIAAAALLGAATATLEPTQAAARAFVAFHVGFAPPPLLVYQQPPCPGYGFIWTPGYWAWDDYSQRYYWVPGAWVRPPRVGYLWTPGYWAWDGLDYVFYDGYWGPTVGFYGGINYGFGYTGWGYEGGYWRDREFYYNSRVNNLRDFDHRYIYDRDVHEDHRFGRTSYAGGRGGVTGLPNRQQFGALNQPRIGATQPQQQWTQQNNGRGGGQNGGVGFTGGHRGGGYGHGQGAPNGGPPTYQGLNPHAAPNGQAFGYRQGGAPQGVRGQPVHGGGAPQPQGQFQRPGGRQVSAPQPSAGGQRTSTPHSDGGRGGDYRR